MAYLIKRLLNVSSVTLLDYTVVAAVLSDCLYFLCLFSEEYSLTSVIFYKVSKPFFTFHFVSEIFLYIRPTLLQNSFQTQQGFEGKKT